MPTALRRGETLAEAVTSDSGVWSLRYDAEGHAVIVSIDGTVTWAAGAPGQLRLEPAGALTVFEDGLLVWRSDLNVRSCERLYVTDDGDAVLYDGLLPVYSLRTGRIDLVVLGDRAPAAEIHGNRVIRTADGKRTAVRSFSSPAVIHDWHLNGHAIVQPDELPALEQPGTWLTWRSVEVLGRPALRLVLVNENDDILWVEGAEYLRRHAATPTASAGESDDRPEWLYKGLGLEAYCLTVVQDTAPDEVLRRFGATDDQITTATWERLREICSEETGDLPVAAFAVGPHTLLVEEHGHEAVDRPDLSGGTFAASSYCSVDADHRFLVSRDGETVVTFSDFRASETEGPAPEVLTDALAAMGIDDIEEFDSDDTNVLDDVELVSRLTGVFPTVEDVQQPARVLLGRRAAAAHSPGSA